MMQNQDYLKKMGPIYLAMNIYTNIIIELELECPHGFDLNVKFGYTTKCP
jgi:hypothetical protein